MRICCDALKRTIDLCGKFFSGNRAAFKVPIKCRIVLRRSSFGLLAMTELGSNPASHFIPGDGLGLTGIKLLNPPGYFIVPGVLNRALILFFKTID
jgi:hypothetical protein